MDCLHNLQRTIRIDAKSNSISFSLIRPLSFTLNSNGTSMISLIIPPKDQISRIAKMLADEFGTASNIKSRVNRLSVLGAIISVQQRLKLYTKVPPNGLVVYWFVIVFLAFFLDDALFCLFVHFY